MGIQINGVTDSITAVDGSLSLTGAELASVGGINVSGVVTATTYIVGSGSTSAPSISPSGDSNTGIFFPSADTIAFGEGGSEVARIDSNGRVAIGTNTSLSAEFEVFGGTTSTIQIKGGAGGSDTARRATLALLASGNKLYNLRADASDGSFQVLDSSTERVRIDSNGNLGIGTTNPQTKLDIQGGEVYYHSGTNNNLGIKLTYSNGNSTGIIDTYGNHALEIRTNNTERARINSNGTVLVGLSTAPTVGNAAVSKLVVQSYVGSSTGQGILSLQAGLSPTTAVSGDKIAEIGFNANNGSPFAEIAAFADAAPSTNDYPGRLVFSTTADGESSPTERMRIGQDGRVGIAITASTMATHVPNLGIYAGTQGTDNTCVHLASDSSGSGTRGFLICSSNYTSSRDTEFALNNNGQAYADGSWNGGGADYAEYFEWVDSNPDEEDRRGISVVLDGNKIREAVAGEDPIGVISGNPSVVGDAAWNKWSGKYLRDDFGTYIQEDYEVINDEGETVVQQRRKLNPAYDPDQEYIPREQRPEWDCVGLMGKLRIRKGQITGSRWIKMRDISDTVEEWLVR